MHTFARKPVELVRGAGMEVEDDEGRTYLDFIAGIGVDQPGPLPPGRRRCAPAAGGEAHPREQLLLHRSTAAKWPASSPTCSTTASPRTRQPWQSFFANSGAEANECAIKLARLHARKRAAAQARAPGQGRTGRALPRRRAARHRHARPQLPRAHPGHAGRHGPARQAGGVPAPARRLRPYGTRTTWPHSRRCSPSRGDEICAVMVECVQGESGVHPCTPEFLQACTPSHRRARRAAHVRRGPVRASSAAARTRSRFQHFGIMPDVVTIAKGVASGLPTGMCAARADVAASFDAGDHGSTFGGSYLAVAAAEATLRTLADEGLAARVERVGAYLRERAGAAASRGGGARPGAHGGCRPAPRT